MSEKEIQELKEIMVEILKQLDYIANMIADDEIDYEEDVKMSELIQKRRGWEFAVQ